MRWLCWVCFWKLLHMLHVSVQELCMPSVFVWAYVYVEISKAFYHRVKFIKIFGMNKSKEYTFSDKSKGVIWKEVNSRRICYAFQIEILRKKILYSWLQPRFTECICGSHSLRVGRCFNVCLSCFLPWGNHSSHVYKMWEKSYM